jgi:hypothetical protein
MPKAPKFERVKDHAFDVKEKVFVIDKNGFDIWEAEITQIQNGTYAIHYLEFPDDDENLTETNRILVNTRVNHRIFNQQESDRQTILPSLSEGEEEPFGSDDYSDGDSEDYRPAKPGSPEPDYRPGRKGGKGKNAVKPRPKGARSNPKRHR